MSANSHTHTQSALQVVFLAPAWTAYYLQPRDYSATPKASDLTPGGEHDPPGEGRGREEEEEEEGWG